MKKVKYLIIACLSIAILSYGVIAFANGGTTANSKELSHGDVTGKFVAMTNGNSKIKLELENGFATYTLDSAVWIFRDQKKTGLENLKSGDKIELILKSGDKVAYIKAFSEVYLKAEAAAVSASPTASPAPTATPNAEPTPAVTPKPTVKPEPSPSPTAVPNENKPIIIIKEDSQVVIAKEGHKNNKNGHDHNDDNNYNDNNGNNDNNDDHQGRNKHDHAGGED